MIQKMKDILSVQEDVDKIKNNVQYATNAISELKDEIASCKEAVKEHDEAFRSQTHELSTTLSEQLHSIKEMQKEFEKELFQFKLLKSQLQKKVLDSFQEELDKELQLQMDVLKTDAEEYRELRSDISGIAKKVNGLSDEIDKFTDISQNIRKGDFELKHFAKQLIEMDKEKLELMRKIDSMERLVSKMRRKPVMSR